MKDELRDNQNLKAQIYQGKKARAFIALAFSI